MAIAIKEIFKGRGATFSPENRFAHATREAFDDGWKQENLDEQDDVPIPLKTTVAIQQARTIISRNNSPDIGFSQSINPYQGCEHGCIYCFARPTHAYLDLSPGLDFETKLFAKPEAPELLRQEFSKKNYKAAPIVIGVNTDAYQPIEREWKITRQLLEVCEEFNHPVELITKSSLIERDIDILARLAEKNLTRVFISITSLDKVLARQMEPRAATPFRRLQAVERLSSANVPVGVLVAPIMPMLNDKDIEAILSASYSAGARQANYVVLRLPHELKELFREWLQQHYPLRAEHIMSVIMQMRGGKEYEAEFGTRMRGTGPFAQFLSDRFSIICKRLGMNKEKTELNTHLFRRPATCGQMELF